MKTINNKHYNSFEWVMLPTKKGKLIKDFDSNKIRILDTTELFGHQHLYILSNEEIKGGDWVLKPDGTLHKMTDKNVLDYIESQSNATKKIIATTNPELKIEVKGVQMSRLFQLRQISTESLQEFVKRYNDDTLGKKVLVEMDCGEIRQCMCENNNCLLPVIKTSPDNTVSLVFEEEDNWDIIYNNMIEKWLKSSINEFSKDTFLDYLKENYNLPTRK